MEESKNTVSVSKNKPTTADWGEKKERIAKTKVSYDGPPFTGGERRRQKREGKAAANTCCSEGEKRKHPHTGGPEKSLRVGVSLIKTKWLRNILGQGRLFSGV